MPQWHLVAPVHAAVQSEVWWCVQVQARPRRFTACQAVVPGQALQRLGRVLEVSAAAEPVNTCVSLRSMSH